MVSPAAVLAGEPEMEAMPDNALPAPAPAAPDCKLEHLRQNCRCCKVVFLSSQGRLALMQSLIARPSCQGHWQVKGARAWVLQPALNMELEILGIERCWAVCPATVEGTCWCAQHPCSVVVACSDPPACATI